MANWYKVLFPALFSKDCGPWGWGNFVLPKTVLTLSKKIISKVHTKKKNGVLHD